HFLNAVSSKLMLFGLTIDAAHLMLLGHKTFVSIKKSNDVVRLQALIDRKKVIITEETIRQALRMDDAAGVDCLPNEEIFAELARMGYEKLSTKLTFSYMALAVICLATGRKFKIFKCIFDCMVRNVDSPTKFLMYPRFLQLMSNAQVGDLSSHNTTYTSPALTQKVFTNMKRIGKGFSGVDTPLFDDMLVQHQVQDVKDATEDEGDNNEVYAKPTPPSPTPATPPPSPTQEPIPSPPQAQTTQPSSPPSQQPSQTTNNSQSAMTLLNTLLKTCATLAKQVANLEQDKIAQAIEIKNLKQRVKRLEKKRQFNSLGLKRLRKDGTAQRVKSSADTIMDDQEDASK
nr:hypothetical protein [Tanacetum cinerariifolium]